MDYRTESESSNKRDLLNRSSGTSIKDSVQNKYVDIINCIISTINAIDSLHGNNSAFNRIKSAYFTRLEELLTAAQAEMTHVLQFTVWDNLVVAFFGETNAGKSTIIETFRVLYDEQRKELLKKNPSEGVDGLIVGDGRADFTKVYEEYALQIDRKPFTLIDVPGIEGKEEDFIDDIKKALTQAHLVFYVQGHNIKPDVATATKIKKYLGDWVNVYSVYNVRGGAFNYRKEEQRKSLIYGDAAQAEKLITESFTEILGGVYRGNISLQALLALCSVAQFSSSRTDLIDIQKKVLKQFVSNESLLSFSHFNDITSLISLKAGNFNDEIIEANKQKLMSLGRYFVGAINSEMDAQASNIEKFSDELKTYGREISIIFADTQKSLRNKLHAENNMLFSQLQRDINEVIDINRSNSDIEDGIGELCDTFSSDFEVKMTSIVRKELSMMSEKLKRKQKSLDCYKSLIEDIYPGNIDPGLEIDFSDAFAEMSVSFGGVLSTLGGAALGACIGAFFGGVGAIPGALLGSGLDLLRKSLFGDGGKDTAKTKVKEELKKTEEKAKSTLDGVCRRVNRRLSKEIETTSKKIKDDLDGLQVISQTLSSAKISLHNSIKEIKNSSYGNI